MNSQSKAWQNGTCQGRHIDDVTDLTSTDSCKSLSLKWLSYRLLQPYSIKVTVGVTEQW